jgi:nascent polypeptide-associated complex subunit alpha
MAQGKKKGGVPKTAAPAPAPKAAAKTAPKEAEEPKAEAPAASPKASPKAAPKASPKAPQAKGGKKGGAPEKKEEEKKPEAKKPEPKKQDPQDEGQVDDDEEDDDDEEESDDADMPDLEPPTEGGKASKASKQSRSEKKSRKAIAKLGLKAVPGIVRVTVKKAKNMLFVIQSPDVFKSPSSDTYLVFGEAKIEDLTQAAQEGLADVITGKAAAQAAKEEAGETAKAGGSNIEEVGDDEEVDESGVESKDIELVMQQANCSRARAVKALKRNDNDIVNAIMDLTM